MSAPAVCPSCWGDHGECPYSVEEARAVKIARKASKAARTGRDRGTGAAPVSDARADAEIASEMRDAEKLKPLADAQRRLGKRGPKPGASRQARYRRRHPEYVDSERGRLERLRARQRQAGPHPGGAA
jgi:hypothetical protein